MITSLAIECGPADSQGRRHVVAKQGDRQHRDKFDTQSEFHRRQFRTAVAAKFELPGDTHGLIDERLLAAADAADNRAAGKVGSMWLPTLVSMADVEAKPIQWLWLGRIARGRISLLVGMPGAGKSFVTCDMAARISTGTPWPDGSPCERGSVLMVTAEDDPADTIRPRLDAHGADVSRIHLLKGLHREETDGSRAEVVYSLSDVGALEASLQQLGDCRLIGIDPIGSFLGAGVDAHRDNEVRARLAPVARLAEKYGAAVLVVMHRRKRCVLGGRYGDGQPGVHGHCQERMALDGRPKGRQATAPAAR